MSYVVEVGGARVPVINSVSGINLQVGIKGAQALLCSVETYEAL